MNTILVGSAEAASADGWPHDVSDMIAIPDTRAIEAATISGFLNQCINDVFGCIRGTMADHFTFGEFFCGVVTF